MKLHAGTCYHVYNQGNNHERLFPNDQHYRRFPELFQTYIVPCCEILCWCLMPNHFHTIIYADTRVNKLLKLGSIQLDPVTNGFRKLLSIYSHEYNTQYARSGSLFRPKTKAKNIITGIDSENIATDDFDYFTKCFHYIHNNPVLAGLVNDPADWKWSSYRYYIGKRKSSFCNKELANRFLGI